MSYQLAPAIELIYIWILSLAYIHALAGKSVTLCTAVVLCRTNLDLGFASLQLITSTSSSSSLFLSRPCCLCSSNSISITQKKAHGVGNELEGYLLSFFLGTLERHRSMCHNWRCRVADSASFFFLLLSYSFSRYR